MATNKPDKNEQWLRGGNCDLCRRKNYCSKPCKAAKGRQQSIIASAVGRVLLDAFRK